MTSRTPRGFFASPSDPAGKSASARTASTQRGSPPTVDTGTGQGPAQRHPGRGVEGAGPAVLVLHLVSTAPSRYPAVHCGPCSQDTIFLTAAGSGALPPATGSTRGGQPRR